MCRSPSAKMQGATADRLPCQRGTPQLLPAAMHPSGLTTLRRRVALRSYSLGAGLMSSIWERRAAVAAAIAGGTAAPRCS